MTYRNDEVMAYPVGETSLFKTVLSVEKAGYEVVDVLPILRCVVVRLNAEQLEQLESEKTAKRRKKRGPQRTHYPA